MAWTILWAILGAFCQAFGSWLGWTMNHDTISPAKRRWAHAGFIASMVIGMASIGVVTYRAGRTERAHLQLDGDIAATVIGTTDIWSKQAEWLPIGMPARLNVNIKDVGNGPAVNLTNFGRVYLEPDASLSSTRDAEAKFEAWRKLQLPRGKETLAVGDPKWSTFFGDVVTPEDFMNVRYGRRMLYEVGTYWFDDDFGPHYHNFCFRLQPPQQGGMIIVAGCEEHTDEK